MTASRRLLPVRHVVRFATAMKRIVKPRSRYLVSGWWLCLGVLFFCPLLYCQQTATLRIDVTTSEGGAKPLELRVDEIVRNATSPASFVVEVVLGTVRIAVEADGHHPIRQELQIDEAREWQIAIELEEMEELEQEITVYATRTNQRVQDLPLRVEVLTEEEIEEKIMMVPGDIVTMLNETGGLRVQTTSPGLGAASVRVQGMRGRYTRFLSDGLPLFGQQGAGLGLLQIPPVDLGQVEVIKGVASALYGAGAMGGVVNLVARRPQAEPIYDFLLNRTSLRGSDATAYLGRRLNRLFSATVLAGGHWQTSRDLDNDGWADVPSYQRGLVKPRLFWDDQKGINGMLTASLTHEDRTGGTMPQSVLPQSGQPFPEALDTRRQDAGGNMRILFADRYLLAMRFAASRQGHVHTFGEVREKDRHELLFGEASLSGSHGRNTWVAGFAAERDVYRALDLPRYSYTFVTPGVFVQDDVTFASWLSVSASARADFHNRYGTFLSPRLSALLRLGEWTNRISVGQGFYATTPLTEETEAAGLSRLAIPAELRAERGRSTSIDLSRSIGVVSLTATAFASSIRNPSFVERGEVYTIRNLPAPTRNRGYELLGVLRKSPFYATASYIYVATSELDTQQRREVPLTPRHSAGLVVMWEAEGTARVGFEAYYTGRQRLEDNPFRDVSRPYVTMGILGERRFGPLRFFINLENFTNVRQTRWDPLLRRQRTADGRWTVDAWSPLDGRVLNGGVRIRF